jgi:hypothetical protein
VLTTAQQAAWETADMYLVDNPLAEQVTSLASGLSFLIEAHLSCLFIAQITIYANNGSMIHHVKMSRRVDKLRRGMSTST